MIETFYFIIIGTQVIMKGFGVESDTTVPHHVVEYCSQLNNVDPYDPTMSDLEELKLYDCYSTLQGYYDGPPLQIRNGKIHRLFN